MAGKFPINAPTAAAALALVASLGTAISVGNIMGDPTTTVGDIAYRGDAGGDASGQIRLGASGAPDGGVLTISNRTLSWASVSSSPTTTRGDMTRRGASADERFALGTTGYVLTSNGTDPVWAAPTGVSTTTYYASDGTPSNGAGGDATATVTGSGASSTIDFSISTTQRLMNSTAIACGSWASPPIPASVKEIRLTYRTTAISGTTAGYRYLQSSLRRNGENPPTNMLYGGAFSAFGGATYLFAGNMRSNSNNGTSIGTVIAASSPLLATNKWVRQVWRFIAGGPPRMWIYTGAADGTTAPAGWEVATLDSQSQLGNGSSAIGLRGTGSLQIVLGLENYTGGAGTATASVELRLEVDQ